MPHRIVSNRPRFVVATCVQWRRARDVHDRAGEVTPKEAAERTHKLRAEANLAELKYQERVGALVPIVDAERQVERIASMIRSRVLGIRGRWAPRVIGLDNMIQAAGLLHEMSRDILRRAQ